jgi:hypothetical protein
MRVALAPFALLVACGSSEASPPPPADPFTTPDAGQSGTLIDRDAACARYAAALRSKATALGCQLTPSPECPGVIDAFEANAGVAGGCPLYDEGTVRNCEARIGTYAECADFAAKPCFLVLQPQASCGAPADAGEG